MKTENINQDQKLGSPISTKSQGEKITKYRLHLS
jgi:hypothetical protein